MDFSKVDDGHPDYKEGEEPLKFYYNREERLKHAPKIVQDYYNGKMTPEKGLFKVLFARRGNRFMFIGIAVFVLSMWLYSWASEEKTGKICGTNITLSVFSYEDNVYSSLKFEESKKQKNVKPSKVDVVFIGLESSGGEAFRTELSDVFEGKEMFLRTKFTDYDIIKVIAEVSAGSEQKKLSSSVERR